MSQDQSPHVDPSRSSSTSPPKLSLLGRSALKYTGEYFYAVHPLRPGDKRPLTSHGFKDASTDRDQIAEWWTEHPTANIGIATGAVSGISVLDVDVKEGAGGDVTLAALLAEHGEALEGHVHQRTWSGGLQYFFRYDPRARQGAGCYGKGLDGRNDGGYVVAPPSIVNGTAYAWVVKPGTLQPMPEWLLAIGAAVAPRSTEQRKPPEWADDLMMAGVAMGERDDAAWKLINHARETRKSEADCWARLTTFGKNCVPPFDPKEDRKIAAKIHKVYAREPVFEGNAPKPILKPSPIPSEPEPEEDPLFPSFGLKVKKMVDVQAKAITWLWPGRIPRGSLTLIVGDPSAGKSFVSEDMTVRLTVPLAWPTGEVIESPVHVVHLLVEDNLETSVKPRIEAMGGDGTLFEVVHGVQGSDRLLSLTEDLDKLRQLFRHRHTKLCVVSPVNAYLGGKDNYKDPDVRAVLTPLGQLAEELDIAIVGIMHLNKTQQTQILYRVGGSIAFTAVPRAAFAVVRDKDDPNLRHFTNVKMSDAKEPKTLPFRIVEQQGGSAVIVWEPETDARASELMAAEPKQPGPKGSKVQAAQEWLLDFLKDGPKPHKDVLAAASEMDYTLITLKRAKKRAGVTEGAQRNSGGRIIDHLWCPPAQPTTGK